MGVLSSHSAGQIILVHYKGMKKELSVDDKRVIEVLGRFSDKLPTEGLVRVNLSVHPLADLEGILFYFFRYVG